MNRRMRNRMSGGVGGRREQSRLLPDPGRPASAGNRYKDDSQCSASSAGSCYT
jgi:hypothetical protein